MTKGMAEIHQLEKSNGSEVFQKHQSLIMYLFIFIHSVMSGSYKNVPLIVRDFHTK